MTLLIKPIGSSAGYDPSTSLAQLGLRRADHIEKLGFEITTWTDCSGTSPLIVEDANGWILCCGTMFYRGFGGQVACSRLLADLRTGFVDEMELLGVYCVIAVQEEGLVLLTDTVGLYPIYANHRDKVVSSMFLACALNTRTTLTINQQALYEYVFQGTTYDNDSIVNEIERLAPNCRHLLNDHSCIAEPRRVFDNAVDAGADDATRMIKLLDQTMLPVIKQFRGGIDTALSGGYDSRLLLALLRRHGECPNLHVYGSDDDQDVVIAKQIAQGEGISLEHVDKSAWQPLLEPEEQVLLNYEAFDGFPPEGIFDSGIDIRSRISRAEGGRIALNGGGGEIFRNFFYLPDRPITPLKLVWSFYSQFDEQTCTSLFDTDRYQRILAEKILKQLPHASGRRLTRTSVELVYPLFRNRFWAARNTAINARIGRCYLPFLSPALVTATAQIPLRRKNCGVLEAEIINAIDPALASYSSSYGFRFSKKVPKRYRLAAFINRQRPPMLRRYAYRIKSRIARTVDSSSDETLRATLPGGLQILARYFKPDRLIEDASQFHRAATLEYVFERLGIE